MRDKQHILPFFLGALIIILLLFLLGQTSIMNSVSGIVQQTFFPLAQLMHSSTTSSEGTLAKENQQLRQQLVSLKQTEADNKALRDQFQTPDMPTHHLLPATIVGMPGTIPNVSFPTVFVLSVGASSGVTTGTPVVLENSLIGIVTAVNAHYAQVRLTTHTLSSFSVKDSNTGAIGIAKGEGNGEILIDHVQLSDTIKIGDMIVSLGSQNVNGKGVVPGLIVGKVTSVEKNPSNLFQTARVVPLVQFDRLATVFVML